MLNVAFKEWAMIVRKLAAGEQALILRKGGIAEEEGVFRPEFGEFWLYPTYFHEPVHPDRPLAGTVSLNHWVRVTAVQFVEDLEPLLKLAGLHGWTEETVRQRYAYRTPGLYVLTVRAYRGPSHTIPESPEYAGCKTWVHLDEPLETEGSVPVLGDEAFEILAAEIRQRLTPP